MRQFIIPVTLSAVSRAAYLRGKMTSLPAFGDFDDWLHTLSTADDFVAELGSEARASIWDDWDVGLEDTLALADRAPERAAPNPFDVFEELGLDLDEPIEGD